MKTDPDAAITAEPAFGTPLEESPFLSHVAREFHQRGTELRRNLSRKAFAKDFIAEFDLKVPEQSAFLESISNLDEGLLGERSALKYAYGHSSRGIMVLERIGKEMYFDHLSQRKMALSEIKKTQASIPATFGGRPGWLVEEAIASPLAGRFVPLDYKFYCFRDQIGFIAQMDRNTYPMNVCLLDSDFRPLVHKRDYVLARPKHRPGMPIPPRHAAELKHWARRLSLMTDSPFVRIDLYDGKTGPVFGEFTFSPGTTHRRWWLYSERMLHRLDGLFLEASAMPSPPVEPIPDGIESISPDADHYSLLASAAANGNITACERLREFYQTAADKTSDPALAQTAAGMAKAWTASRAWLRRRDAGNLDGRLVFLKKRLIDPTMLDRNRPGPKS